MAGSECRWESPEQWSQWSEWLSAGVNGCNRGRLPVLLLGMLFAHRPADRDHVAAERPVAVAAAIAPAPSSAVYDAA
jgi:hypothetical protein